MYLVIKCVHPKLLFNYTGKLMFNADTTFTYKHLDLTAIYIEAQSD